MGYTRGMGLTPGYTPAQQAMADAYAAQFGGGGGGAVYVAPVDSARPACADSPYANINSSQACVDALQAWQQQNMQLANNANYNVDLANCLNTYPQPPDCYQRTFGLTPTGGYTSDAGAGPKGSTLYLNASGQPVTVTPSLVSGPTPNTQPAPIIPKTPLPTPPPPPGGTPLTSPTGGPSDTSNLMPPDNLTGGYVSSATDFLSGDTSIAGFSIPTWGLVAAAGAALLFFLGGKH